MHRKLPLTKDCYQASNRQDWGERIALFPAILLFYCLTKSAPERTHLNLKTYSVVISKCNFFNIMDG